MSKLAARWKIGQPDPAHVDALVRELGIPVLLAKVLVQRGHIQPEDASAFLDPQLDRLYPPALLPDFEAAIKTLMNARESGHRVFIHGDFDVDGVSSAALLYRFLRKAGFEVRVFVPHRKDGHGVSEEAVREAHAWGAKLLLTSDCGVQANDEVRMARALGMHTVVTDHHEPGDELPEADAVVNPHRKDSKYPFMHLSGAGVAFKLMEGLSTKLGHEVRHFHRAFLDLAVLGTVADVVLLEGENRIIVRHGLKQLAESRKPGLRALMRVADVGKGGPGIRARQVAFQLGPRLNAAGRLEDAALSLRLLTCDEEDEADRLAKQLDEINHRRRSEQNEMVEAAVERVLETAAHEKPLIILHEEGWHPGLIGLVAGKLVDRFHRPAFVISTDAETGMGRASIRTIPGFHVAEAIRAFPELMDGGGHEMAGGFSIRMEDIGRLEAALLDYAARRLSADDLVPVLAADAEVQPDEVTMASVASLENLEPTGAGNPEPVLFCAGLELLRTTPTRNEEHRGAVFRGQANTTIGSMGFGLGPRLANATVGQRYDLMFVPKADTWNGRTELKWYLKDYRDSVGVC